MRTITLEEHFATADLIKGPGQLLMRAFSDQPVAVKQGVRIIEQLCDLGDGRIKDMDNAGIDVQVLSLTAPGVEQSEGTEAVEIARDANDRLAAAVQSHPDRFVGLAALPTPLPDRAAQELERMVRKHGFKGAVINGHVRGRYLDDKFFWPILEQAESLGVPIYLHPAIPTQTVIGAYYAGNYAGAVTAMLATGAWGWHIETAIHVLRIILSGVFDKYPKLQIIIGHLGETLPFMLQRLDDNLPRETTKLNRAIGEYLRDNIYYTTSGFNYTQPFLNLLLQVGAGRIIFSADYPYCSMESSRTFLDQLPVSQDDKEKIAYGNARGLLGI